MYACYQIPICYLAYSNSVIYYLLQAYNVLKSEYIDDSWNLLTPVNEDSKFQLFIITIIIIYYYFFFAHVFSKVSNEPKSHSQ